MSRLRLIYGLGNGSSFYEGTRHNLGAQAVLHLAKKLAQPLKVQSSSDPRRALALASCTTSEGTLLIARSLGFMNLSGQPLKSLLNYYQLDLGDLLVVHDDTRLMVGEFQWQEGGPQRGQNGLRSIVKEIGSEAFCRLRLGIASEECHAQLENYSSLVAAHVLSAFTKEESREVESLVELASEQMLSWAKGQKP